MKPKAVRQAASTRVPAARGGSARKPVAKGRGGKPAKAGRPVRPVVPVERTVRIRELDPYARCGPDTSVEQLYRVDESLDGRPTVHLVYLDRHGWYCFHGRACPAVRDVHRELRIPLRDSHTANTALRARA